MPARCFWRPGGRSPSGRRGEPQACLFLRPGSPESCVQGRRPPSPASQRRGRAPRGSLAARGFSCFRALSSLRGLSFGGLCSFRGLCSFGGLSVRGLSSFRGVSSGARSSPAAFSAASRLPGTSAFSSASTWGAGGPDGGTQASGFGCHAGGVRRWGQRTPPLPAQAPPPTARGHFKEALTGGGGRGDAGSGADLGGTHGSGTGAGVPASPATASWRGGVSAQATAHTAPSTRVPPAEALPPPLSEPSEGKAPGSHCWGAPFPPSLPHSRCKRATRAARSAHARKGAHGASPGRGEGQGPRWGERQNPTRGEEGPRVGYPVGVGVGVGEEAPPWGRPRSVAEQCACTRRGSGGRSTPLRSTPWRGRGEGEGDEPGEAGAGIQDPTREGAGSPRHSWKAEPSIARSEASTRHLLSDRSPQGSSSLRAGVGGGGGRCGGGAACAFLRAGLRGAAGASAGLGTAPRGRPGP